MKLLGWVLMYAGLGIGAALAVAMVSGVTIPGLSWFFAVGIVKLTMLGAIGLIATGAVLHRLSMRAEARDRLMPGPRSGNEL